MFILKFCSQILIAINKEKNIINTENSMFMLKFCSQIVIAINNKINSGPRHLIQRQIVLAVIWLKIAYLAIINNHSFTVRKVNTHKIRK
jgi:hypothetical protein